jgi:hypothetical protein
MAVDAGASVTGHVLEHRQDAAAAQPLGDGCADGGDFRRALAVGTIADDRVGSRQGEVGERHAVDIDADRGEIRRDQPRAEPRRRQPELRRAVVQSAIDRAGRIILRPMRRPQPLHPPAFLVDQHGSIGAPHRRAKIANQRPDLGRRTDVARE